MHCYRPIYADSACNLHIQVIFLCSFPRRTGKDLVPESEDEMEELEGEGNSLSENSNGGAFTTERGRDRGGRGAAGDARITSDPGDAQ